MVEEIGDRIGHATNNVAEYQALLTGLETALDRGCGLRILSDSLLLVRQMRQEFKVKNLQLRELWLRARPWCGRSTGWRSSTCRARRTQPRISWSTGHSTV